MECEPKFFNTGRFILGIWLVDLVYSRFSLWEKEKENPVNSISLHTKQMTPGMVPLKDNDKMFFSIFEWFPFAISALVANKTFLLAVAYHGLLSCRIWKEKNAKMCIFAQKRQPLLNVGKDRCLTFKFVLLSHLRVVCVVSLIFDFELSLHLNLL